MRSKGEKRKTAKKADPVPVEAVQKKLERNTSELSEEEAKEIAQTAERLNEHPEDEAAVRMNDEGSPHDVEVAGEAPDIADRKRHPVRKAS